MMCRRLRRLRAVSVKRGCVSVSRLRAGRRYHGLRYAHRIRERAAYDWDAELSIYLAQGTHGHGVGTAVLACLIDLLELQGCATCTAA